MSSHKEQIQPAAFDVATPAPAEPAAAAGIHARPERPSWVLPSLLVLGLLAMLVFFWLPGRVGPASVAPPDLSESPAPPPPATAKKSADQAPEASPWSDAQLAKLRKEAQDVLAELLEVQGLLENIGVELWAAESFDRAKVYATEGDTQYRDRQFVEARASYEQGLAGMKAILESEPDVLEEQLELAREAIERGERELAESAMDIAAAIEPDNSVLATLRTRVDALERLLPLLNEAQMAEEDGDLAAAETLLKEASALDPLHRRTLAELARVAAAYTAMRFNDAMSDGYLALDESRFSAARDEFNKAAGLAPGSREAGSALQEVQVAETAKLLSSLQDRGRAAESKEQWQEALEAYEQALGIDNNILYAQEGFKRSQTRARLDRQFSSAIEEPERLSDQAVAEATATLLRQAATISPRGPVLERQMKQLDGLLKKANTPLSLTLRSDGETDVIVYKVVRLGQFQQRELNLRPGKYTAVGTRSGYRDVRVTFNLSHDGPQPAVVISCTEQI